MELQVSIRRELLPVVFTFVVLMLVWPLLPVMGSTASVASTANSTSATVRLVLQPARTQPAQVVRLRAVGRSVKRCTVRSRSLALHRTLGSGVNSFLVPLRTRPGKHRIALKCGKQRAHRSLTVFVSDADPGTGSSDVAEVDCSIGCGGGGNPFPSGQCTYHGYEQRSDIYNRAVLLGQPRSGWHGYQWGVRARAVGYSVDSRPQSGDLAVYSREYFGGPNNDGAGGQYGHVAYVIAVSGQNYTVSERNYRGNPNITSRTLTLRPGVEFVHQFGDRHSQDPLASGTRHFSTFVGADGSLRVSHWTGSSWQTDNLGQGLAAGTSPSAYLGANGTHFVYFVGNDRALRVSHWTGSVWQTDNLGIAVAADSSPSAYLGANGQHFVYATGADGSLRVSHWTGSSWQTDNLGQGLAAGTSPSAYLGANGTHFVYFVGNDRALRVSHWTGSVWQTDNLGIAVAADSSPSAYLGANGQHFVYATGADGSLRVSHWTGSSWQTDNLGQGLAAGTSPSAYLGANGTALCLFRRATTALCGFLTGRGRSGRPITSASRWLPTRVRVPTWGRTVSTSSTRPGRMAACGSLIGRGRRGRPTTSVKGWPRAQARVPTWLEAIRASV